jgi:thiamine biosynthesis lipoprotein
VTSRTIVAMGTVVTIQVPGPVNDTDFERAFGWFFEIEERCTRFHLQSELMELTVRPGEAVAVSAILFEAVRFSVAVAEETGGAFDPTGGHWRDVEADPARQTLTLHRPMRLDLGAVAKGMAVDTAARELEGLRDFLIDAGGDIYAGGCSENAEPWTIGIRHPRRAGELIASLSVSGEAVCTSGDYERGQHIPDPRTGEPVHGVASATVIAPTAMLADALATAAFVLGPEQGIAMLERLSLKGLIIASDLQRCQTRSLCGA